MDDTTTALLTEHFSFTPLSLIDDIINSINNLVYQAISSLEDGLLNTPPEKLGFKHAAGQDTIPDTDEDGNVQYPEARLEIENGLQQLETLLEATVDKAFDKFEIYVLRNILTVPPELMGSVKLAHYENLSFPTGPDAPTPESIKRQREKLRETRKLNRLLRQESARNEAVLGQLRSILSSPPKSEVQSSADKPEGERVEEEETATSSTPTTSLPNLSFLLNDPVAKRLNVGDDAGPNHTPLTTNTTFILSQLPALRALLEKLRPKLAALSKQSPQQPGEIDPKREERRDYIDTRTRLHLERTGELGGSAGEGHGVLKGRRVDGEEVKALESVAGMFD